MRRPETTSLTPFWGVPAYEVSRWCQCSATTARLYKSGVRRPSKAALTLFTLHRDGRVLEPHLWADWAVRHGHLVNRAGWELTQGQLAAYHLVYQLAFELAGTRERDRLHRLLAELDAA